MEKKEGKISFSLIVVSVLIIMLIIPLISAGLLDWFKKTITGKAMSQPTNVSITISGINPVTIAVWNYSLNGSATDPTEEGIANITFNITVNDIDGVNDINDSSVIARVFKSGGTTRYNDSACSEISTESTATSQNYTCTVQMWYWDTPGIWTINVSANDLGNKTYIYNDSQTFQYNQLQSIKISPPLVSWASVVPGATNQTPAQYTTINNTGNYNVTAGNIKINSTNLYSGTNFIDVQNITADIDTGTSACDGTNMTNGIYMGVTTASLTRGNLSQGGGVAQEQIYYCLTSVPNTLPSGTYDTASAGSWTIKIS